MKMPAHSGVCSKLKPCCGSQMPCSQMISMNISPPRDRRQERRERAERERPDPEQWQPEHGLVHAPLDHREGDQADRCACHQRQHLGARQPVGWPPAGRCRTDRHHHQHQSQCERDVAPPVDRRPSRDAGSSNEVGRRCRTGRSAPRSGTPAASRSAPAARPAPAPGMPLTPAMLMPSARPRGWRKASVMIAAALASRQRRRPLHDPKADQVGGAGGAVIQSIASQRGHSVDHEAEVVDAHAAACRPVDPG